jgi:hypothetical protein
MVEKLESLRLELLKLRSMLLSEENSTPEELEEISRARDEIRKGESIGLIENKIASERRKAKDREKIRAASKTQDRIARTLSRRYSGNWKGTEVIRYWREHRYSSSTRQ